MRLVVVFGYFRTWYVPSYNKSISHRVRTPALFPSIALVLYLRFISHYDFYELYSFSFQLGILETRTQMHYLHSLIGLLDVYIMQRLSRWHVIGKCNDHVLSVVLFVSPMFTRILYTCTDSNWFGFLGLEVFLELFLKQFTIDFRYTSCYPEHPRTVIPGFFIFFIWIDVGF